MATNMRKMRDESSEALQAGIRQMREQLFKLRWQAAGGQAENPNKIKMIRRDIARHLTLLRERQAALPAAKPVAGETS